MLEFSRSKVYDLSEDANALRRYKAMVTKSCWIYFCECLLSERVCVGARSVDTRQTHLHIPETFPNLSPATTDSHSACSRPTFSSSMISVLPSPNRLFRLPAGERIVSVRGVKFFLDISLFISPVSFAVMNIFSVSSLFASREQRALEASRKELQYLLLIFLHPSSFHGILSPTGPHRHLPQLCRLQRRTWEQT